MKAEEQYCYKKIAKWDESSTKYTFQILASSLLMFTSINIYIFVPVWREEISPYLGFLGFFNMAILLYAFFLFLYTIDRLYHCRKVYWERTNEN